MSESEYNRDRVWRIAKIPGNGHDAIALFLLHILQWNGLSDTDHKLDMHVVKNLWLKVIECNQWERDFAVNRVDFLARIGQMMSWVLNDNNTHSSMRLLRQWVPANVKNRSIVLYAEGFLRGFKFKHSEFHTLYCNNQCNDGPSNKRLQKRLAFFESKVGASAAETECAKTPSTLGNGTASSFVDGGSVGTTPIEKRLDSLREVALGFPASASFQPNQYGSMGPNPNTRIHPNQQDSVSDWGRNPNQHATMGPNPNTRMNPNQQASVSNWGSNPNQYASMGPNPDVRINPNQQASVSNWASNPNQYAFMGPNSDVRINSNQQASVSNWGNNPNQYAFMGPNPNTGTNPHRQASVSNWGRNSNQYTSMGPNPNTRFHPNQHDSVSNWGSNPNAYGSVGNNMESRNSFFSMQTVGHYHEQTGAPAVLQKKQPPQPSLNAATENARGSQTVQHGYQQQRYGPPHSAHSKSVHRAPVYEKQGKDQRSQSGSSQRHGEQGLSNQARIRNPPENRTQKELFVSAKPAFTKTVPTNLFPSDDDKEHRCSTAENTTGNGKRAFIATTSKNGPKHHKSDTSSTPPDSQEEQGLHKGANTSNHSKNEDIKAVSADSDSEYDAMMRMADTPLEQLLKTKK